MADKTIVHITGIVESLEEVMGKDNVPGIAFVVPIMTENGGKPKVWDVKVHGKGEALMDKLSTMEKGSLFSGYCELLITPFIDGDVPSARLNARMLFGDTFTFHYSTCGDIDMYNVLGKMVMTACGPIARPELFYTQTGTPIFKCSIPTEIWLPGQGNQTQWIRCTIFGKKAADIYGKVIKGSIAKFSGDVSIGCWVSKQDGSPEAAIDLKPFLDAAILISNYGKDKFNQAAAASDPSSFTKPTDSNPF